MSPANAATYDELGRGYSAARHTDPRIAAHIEAALGEARTVLNVGAEALPFEDDSFDVAMAINSDHHWRDRKAGLAEMRRVARDRVLLLNADPAAAGRFWLTRDYLDNLDGLITSRYRLVGRFDPEGVRGGR